MPTKKPKSKVTKKSNVGLKAAKFKPVKAGFKLSSLKRVNRTTLVVVALVVAMIGGFLVYHSFAATTPGYSRTGESIDIGSVNAFRASIGGLQNLVTNACLTTMAENWSLTMSTKGFMHNPNLSSGLTNCAKTAGGFAYWGAENIVSVQGAGGSTCNISASDPCSTTTNPGTIYSTFYNSAEHQDNMKACAARSVGVGIYVNSAGVEWATQDYMSLSPYTLCGHSTVAPAGSSSATKTINVNRSQAVTFYEEVDAGNGTVAVPVHVDSYHYNKAGALISSAALTASTPTISAATPVTPYKYNNTATIPATATSGDRYCHQVYYGAATGPGTAAAISNLACAVVN